MTGNTQVVSDWLLVRIGANPGESTLDRMIALVEGAKRQKTPNEVALDILLIGLTLIFLLLVVVTLKPFALFAGGNLPLVFLVALLVTLIPTTIGGLLPAIPASPAWTAWLRLERDRQVRSRGGGGRRRPRAAARQDRHHHLRQLPLQRAVRRAGG